MSNTGFYIEKESEICREILAWSQHTLQKPNPYYNGMPPCPYAKKAWEDDKVIILFKYDANMQVLYSTISQWEEAFDLAIIVDMAFQPDPEVFHDYLEQLNNAISEGVFIDRDIWLMGFHPHDDSNDFIDDSSFMQIVDDEYALIFVQRLSKVQEAADKLAEKGYYDNYLEEYDAEYIFEERKNLYRRLKSWQ
jgi:hypothetical protein|tara:strand:+ start:3861 stop:4439 length:579 start_codon:yes stop_codon:yes gene_type:complete